MPKPLSEQVVVITGASSGIGRCTALYLAERGARVVVTARREDALDSLVQEIKENGGQARAVPGDVTSEDDLKKAAQTAVDEFGYLDTWVNNAAVYIQGRVQDITLEEYRRVIEVNLLGMINGTKCALEHMLRQDEGGIIQISSIMGLRSSAFSSPYAASKAGIEGFTGALRTELWKTNIYASTLYPPMVDTPIYHRARGKFGTIPKPPPPVVDPIVVAKQIARLAERPKNKHVFGHFGWFYHLIGILPSGVADWFLHQVGEFAMSNIPDQGDNLFEPVDEPPQIRAGWADEGWNGLTLSEVVRVMPWASMVGAIAIGLSTGRAARRLFRRGS